MWLSLQQVVYWYVCTHARTCVYPVAANYCFSLYYPETVDILKKVNSKMYMYFRKVLQLACQGQDVAAAKVLVAITKCVLQSEQTFSLVRCKLKMWTRLRFIPVFYAISYMKTKFEEHVLWSVITLLASLPRSITQQQQRNQRSQTLARYDAPVMS